MGASKFDVMTYFRQLAGIERMPLAQTVPGKGTLYKAKSGNSSKLLYIFAANGSVMVP